jgi:hypothetical protein
MKMEESKKQGELFPEALPKKRGRPRKNPLPEAPPMVAVYSMEVSANEDIRKLARFLDYWSKAAPSISTEHLLLMYSHITM